MRRLGYGLLLAGVQLAFVSGLRADDQSEAKPVLEKALKAVGGEKKVTALKTAACKIKMNATEGGQEIVIAVEAAWNGLDQYRLDADAQVAGRSEKMLMIVNKDKGWMQARGKTEDAPKEIPEAIKGAFYGIRMPQLLAMLKDPSYKLSPLGEDKVDNKPAVGLLVSHKDHKDVRLFFDKESGLPVKSEVTVNGPNNMDATIECVYSEYKETEGLKQPAKVAMKVNVNGMTIDVKMEVSDLKTEEKADETLFAKP